MTGPRDNSRVSRGRRGLAVVEAALLFPVLLVLTFGAIEYGWMFLKQEQLNNTARQAARLGAVAGSTNAQVTAQISSMMSGYGMGSSGYTATVTPSSGLSGWPRGSLVTVRVSVAYANVQVVGFSLLPAPNTISATVTMEKEGP